MTNVFSRFGAPKQILTDRGPEFEGALFSQLLEWMQIDKLRTTAYKPATNGVVERFHRTLNSMLGKMVKESQRDWDEKLPFALAAYRATQHDSSGYTPNKLFLGREVRTPLDLIMGLSAEDALQVDTMDDYVVQMYERAESAYKVAREHLRAAAERRKATYDIRVKPVAFCVGDWVLYWYPRRYQRRSPKWQRQYFYLFIYLKVIKGS
jgi:transposase InsO family protein